MSSDEEQELSTPPEITKQAQLAVDNLLPVKSKKLYEKTYAQFMDWRSTKNTTSFSEDVVIVYFEELSSTKKASSLWTHYSMIRSTLNIKHQIDISKYSKVISLLKRKSEGYRGKKSKIFTSEQIEKFINEAPDDKHLLTKVSEILDIENVRCINISLCKTFIFFYKF